MAFIGVIALFSSYSVNYSTLLSAILFYLCARIEAQLLAQGDERRLKFFYLFIILTNRHEKNYKNASGGVILLSMMLPLCVWAAEDYSKYTHVPGNYIDLNPKTNSTTSHSGCKYESSGNVGYIKNGCSSTYHIRVDQKGEYALSMCVARPGKGTFTLTITDEATSSQELEQTFDIPNVDNYAECKFALEKALTAGYKTVKMTYRSSSTGYLMNYKNLTFKANTVLAKWDFNDAEHGYVQKEGTVSPYLTYYPAEGSYAYGNQTMFTLSTGGVKGGGLNQAILNTNKDLELREGKAPSGFISEADMTDGSKHYLYYEISVPTIGFESVTLTARVSHNQSNHNMYAVYSADGGTTWEGTQKVALSNSQSSYLPLSIVIPGGKDNVLVRLHPDNNWYYYLQSCTLSGEPMKSYKVKTNAKGWASFSAVQPVGLPAGLKAYAATDINETHVKLNELTQVAAEEGVFVNGAPSTEYTLNVLENEVTKETINLIKPILVASAGHEVANTETIYALATKGGKCGLYRVQPDVTVKGKAYLDATGKSITKAPMFYELGDGAATGIVEVRAATVQNQTNTCYNVLGQRVAKNVKGIVLVNGKKMLNK